MSTSSDLRILVVDDESSIRRLIRISLGSFCTVIEAENGVQALQLAATNRLDAIILELCLPDMTGLDVIRILREWTLLPVIVISVSGHETDKVAVLDAGADDYLTKPFGVEELAARIRAALRHCPKTDFEAPYECGSLRVNLAFRQVKINNHPVALTRKEYEILSALVKHAGKVLTHSYLIRSIWNDDADSDLHLLRVNISNLRKKIEQDPFRPRFIITEPGVGYRLNSMESEARS